MTFKLKSGNTSTFKMMGSSPAKQLVDKPQQGPINAPKNKKLYKGEMEGTSISSSKSKSEMINDFEERAGFLTDNDITNDGSKKDNQLKKTAKNLNREADIIRDRTKKPLTQEQKEDAAGVGGGTTKKVMNDGPKNKAVFQGKVIKGDFTPHQFNKNKKKEKPAPTKIAPLVAMAVKAAVPALVGGMMKKKEE